MYDCSGRQSPMGLTCSVFAYITLHRPLLFRTPIRVRPGARFCYCILARVHSPTMHDHASWAMLRGPSYDGARTHGWLHSLHISLRIMLARRMTDWRACRIQTPCKHAAGSLEAWLQLAVRGSYIQLCAPVLRNCSVLVHALTGLRYTCVCSLHHACVLHQHANGNPHD